jgi:hypothetical protein
VIFVGLKFDYLLCNKIEISPPTRWNYSKCTSNKLFTKVIKNVAFTYR